MSVESNLEIYKIILGRRTFKEIIRDKNMIPANVEKTDEELFTLLFSNILNKLTQDSAWTSDQTKLGLALFSNEGENVNNILTIHSNSNGLEGYIDGGFYDNLPLNLAIELGADEIIAVDLKAVGFKREIKDKNIVKH